MTHRLVCLKFEAADRRVFFVLKQKKYPFQEGSTPENFRYYYEEHSCPTNWFHDIVAVIEGGDADPHGFLKFVATAEIPEGFDPKHPGADNGIGEAEIWAKFFPQIFSEGAVIDGDAVDVSRTLTYTTKDEA